MTHLARLRLELDEELEGNPLDTLQYFLDSKAHEWRFIQGLWEKEAADLVLDSRVAVWTASDTAVSQTAATLSTWIPR